MDSLDIATTGLRARAETVPGHRDGTLRRLAREMEAAFLAEMLGAAGVARPPEGFGGGAGEDHFSGFLVREYAGAVAAAGGIGLSEAIFRALSAAESPGR